MGNSETWRYEKLDKPNGNGRWSNNYGEIIKNWVFEPTTVNDSSILYILLLEWAEKQQGTIVDLACGTGRITIPLAKRGFSMIGIDINEGMLKKATKKTNNTKLSIQWMMQDCTKLSLENNSSVSKCKGLGRQSGKENYVY
ncbi:class I SAM-dependent methyltransferase [Cytobacillus sp. IB215316]|uniref:class I SAM-dependent methyltransferase n=1 Tax=Cytobacillus sp. IB215316 TaxID=3097354 RepID=UPI002A0CA29F|nr:class I SAM-dependent methyltransferase [Cytobacillus sp. IB215316]MDX8362628.1 class I SAM-dependent methyltransferase [Cytobacillus sp. IB215316]